MSAATGYTTMGDLAMKGTASRTGEATRNENSSPNADASASLREENRKSPKVMRWTAPKVLAAIFVVAAVLVLTLMSYAELVVVNDQLVARRSELSDLQAEAKELNAEYELAYDLSTIETQLLSSGQMTKVQDWQTYTLELAKPDSVEYYQSNDIFPKVLDVMKQFGTAVKEYF